MIYLAPLQGFTDYVYRKAYAEVFRGIDAYFIPYITLQNEKILRKYEREILPENNPQSRVVPQILVKDENETAQLTEVIKKFGYHEMNLNMGCPYPMVTNRGRGAALLRDQKAVEKILDTLFSQFEGSVSVKLRAGLDAPQEIEAIIQVLNRFPLAEVILHPRIAKQLYKGELFEEAVDYSTINLKHRLVFNGDLCSYSDVQKRQEQFPEIQHWMIGRGVLMNAFLPAEIEGRQFSEMERRQMLKRFHSLLLEIYLKETDNPGNAANKLQQFWYYFSHHFQANEKVLKRIKKARNFEALKAEAASILNNSELRNNFTG